MTVTLRDLVTVLDATYPRHLAEDWDAVGLVCGDLDDEVSSVLLSVDVTDAVVTEALDSGVQALVAHHPLFLRGVHGVGTDSFRGRLLHRLVRGGCALFTAHTNADTAVPGVSDALARVIGLQGLSALSPRGGEPVHLLVTQVPAEHRDRVLDALAAAGAGRIGDYERCGWWSGGTGTFEPQPGAQPSTGEVGSRSEVAEDRLEVVVPAAAARAVVAALRASHPYEEPAFQLLTTVPPEGAEGLGRVGQLPSAMSLQAFAEHVARVLPRTNGGVRIAGPVHAQVERVAVCGGAGDSLIGAARAAGADVLVTADLRHHPVADAMEVGGPWLVDVPHWASEWPFLIGARERVLAALDPTGERLDVAVSRTVTDPWTSRA
ncbi:Nif3-like dinuclear metal center hexameric protein [Aquipuribacter sp. SD81]|uniref:Nif3-like dinuclear metal center hexameric protein n=1 Tax=Aquipuribacter sp. SD81 TaxID=3127703 RepID=UPI0030172355